MIRPVRRCFADRYSPRHVRTRGLTSMAAEWPLRPAARPVCASALSSCPFSPLAQVLDNLPVG